MYYRVLVASQRYHGKGGLTYFFNKRLKIGQLVKVELQNKSAVGIVELEVEKPEFNTKPISNAWDIILPLNSLQLMSWIKEYYPAPEGVITELFTPPSLISNLSDYIQKHISDEDGAILPKLTIDQKQILEYIKSSKSNNFLLHGDTGTGKTRIYIELTKNSINMGRSVVILTPEIGLTKSLLKEFRASFGDRVLVTHSQLTPAQRRNIWLELLKSIEPVIIIGPRSALFMPITNIGLIVVDESHDTSYKQEKSPYYQSTRIAGKLSELHNARLILGSATPSIVDYYAFKNKNLPVLRLKSPAIKNSYKNDYEIIDQRLKSNFTRSPWISNRLLSAMEAAISDKEQSMLFLNRRGSARLILCENCGWQSMCPNCDVPLTFHQDQHLSRCHSCSFAIKPNSNCPQCKSSEIMYRSIGTKALEQEVIKLIPQAKIIRIDKDTDKEKRLINQYENIFNGKIDVIIGTQSIIKGFDLPKLSVVGIINADSGVQLPDYTSTERSYQLISQVSGRIGRGHRNGKLFVQSYNPESNLISLAITKKYEEFIEIELSQRQKYRFPPYYYLLKIICTRTSSNSSKSACVKLKSELNSKYEKIIIEGPAPRFIEKVSGRYSWQLILKSKNRGILSDIAKDLTGNFQIDMDPSDLL